MKTSHIFGLIIIAIAIGIIMTTASDASTYADFATAETMMKQGENEAIHVVGKPKKDGSGNIVGMKYEPAVDANRFEFVLVDNNNREQKVIYNDAKPQDFGKAEQIVIIGNMENDVFKCSKILLKCPSKYQEGGPQFEEVKRSNS